VPLSAVDGDANSHIALLTAVMNRKNEKPANADFSFAGLGHNRGPLPDERETSTLLVPQTMCVKRKFDAQY
jgi:hypothetical protein